MKTTPGGIRLYDGYNGYDGCNGYNGNGYQGRNR